MVRPPTKDETKQAILTLLGGLPHGWDMRFFWDDGCQCLTVLKPGENAENFRMVRAADGTGHFVEY